MAALVSVVVKAPGQEPRLVSVPNEDGALKALIGGGWLAAVRFSRLRGLYVFFNDEAELGKHMPNLAFRGFALLGTVFVAACRGEEGDIVNLDESDLAYIEQRLGPVDRTNAAPA
jgi:hypothetical protein